MDFAGGMCGNDAFHEVEELILSRLV